MDKIAEMQKITDRTMKYPYTLGAQVRQFPYRFYWNNSWIFKYWCISTVLCTPIFFWIQSKARTPENIKKWKEIRAKEAAEHH